MSVFTQNTVYVVHTCPTCGVKYALDQDWDGRRRDNGGSWYCPAGHYVAYKTPEVTRLRNALEDAQREAINARERVEAERRAHAATKGVLTKVRRRIGKGVCPSCNRHFENVERHMASKHPEHT